MASVPGGGRLAQRESASFTPRRSLVRSQYRPPSVASRVACRLLTGCRNPDPAVLTRSAPTGRNLGDQLLWDGPVWIFRASLPRDVLPGAEGCSRDTGRGC